MTLEEKNITKEKNAVKIASFGALSLAIVKFTYGIISGSMTLLASAADSLLDLMVSIFNLLALKESHKPADKEHNYGHGKIEGVAAVIEGFIIILSGCGIIFSSIKKLILKTPVEGLNSGIYVMLFSIFITGIIVYFLGRTAKHTKSLIIKADLTHYTMDFLSNTGVIIALIIIKFTGWHFIDPIVAIGIAIYIMIPSRKIIKEGFDILMDTSINKDEEIEKIILNNKKIESYHKLKTHKSGGKIFISFHMVFKDKNISLKEANQISCKIEQNLKNHFKEPTSILIRLDPYDEIE